MIHFGYIQHCFIYIFLYNPLLYIGNQLMRLYKNLYSMPNVQQNNK